MLMDERREVVPCKFNFNNTHLQPNWKPKPHLGKNRNEINDKNDECKKNAINLLH